MAFWYLNFKSQTWLKCDERGERRRRGQIEFSSVKLSASTEKWNLYDFVCKHTWCESEWSEKQREKRENLKSISHSTRAISCRCGMIFITFASDEMRMSQRHEWNSSNTIYICSLVAQWAFNTLHIRNIYIRIILIFSSNKKCLFNYVSNKIKLKVSITWEWIDSSLVGIIPPPLLASLSSKMCCVEALISSAMWGGRTMLIDEMSFTSWEKILYFIFFSVSHVLISPITFTLRSNRSTHNRSVKLRSSFFSRVWSVCNYVCRRRLSDFTLLHNFFLIENKIKASPKGNDLDDVSTSERRLNFENSLTWHTSSLTFLRFVMLFFSRSKKNSALYSKRTAVADKGGRNRKHLYYTRDSRHYRHHIL